MTMLNKLKNAQKQITMKEKGDSITLSDKSFFGRENLLAMLEKSCKPNPLGNFFAIYGVRRAGKTFLIRHFFELQKRKLSNEVMFCLNVVGDLNKTDEDNLLSFYYEIEREVIHLTTPAQFEQYLSEKKIKTDFECKWLRAEAELVYAINFLEKIFERKIHIYCFFDEFPWLAKNQKEIIIFLGALVNGGSFDKRYFNLFIASSLKSWMVSEVFNNISSLHRRFHRIEVEPFSFPEIKAYFKQQGYVLTSSEVFDYFLMFGGFLKHYKTLATQIDLSQSLEKNICTERFEILQNYFLSEADDLFKNVLKERKYYQPLLTALCALKQGSVKEISEQISKQKTKKSADAIKRQVRRDIAQLVELEFLKELQGFGEKRYHCPNQLIFFCEYFADFKIQKKENLFQQWRGAAFELFVLDNLSFIEKKYQFLAKKIWLNRQVRENEFKEGTENTILAQLDLFIEIERKQDKQVKNYFYLFEIKNKDSSQLTELDMEKIQFREDVIKALLKEKIKNKITISSEFICREGRHSIIEHDFS